MTITIGNITFDCVRLSTSRSGTARSTRRWSRPRELGGRFAVMDDDQRVILELAAAHAVVVPEHVARRLDVDVVDGERQLDALVDEGSLTRTRLLSEMP